jgi:hypothetical protein
MLVEKKYSKVNNFGVEALQSIAWVIRALCLYKISNINEKGVEDCPNSFYKIVYEAKETLEKLYILEWTIPLTLSHNWHMWQNLFNSFGQVTTKISRKRGDGH